jgi:hypothetical protein
LFLLLLATHAGAAPPLYRQTATVILGPPDHWDYLTFDPGTQRVFMARDTEITAVDGRTLRVAGRVPGPGGAHGVAVVPGGQGYAAFGGGTVLVFNPATLRITGQVAVQPGADALVQDAMRQALYVINGKNGDATLIDTPTPCAPPFTLAASWNSRRRAGRARCSSIRLTQARCCAWICQRTA